MPELYGEAEPARDVIVDLPRTSDNDRRRAVIRGDYKIVAESDDQAFQLYDLVRDPGEDHDLKWKDRPRFEELTAAYREWSAKIPSVCPRMGVKLRGKKRYKRC